MPKGQETPRKAAGRGSKVAATERRRLFVAAYIANARNGREAARAAGYEGTEHALAVTASRLLKRADIQAALNEHSVLACLPTEFLAKLVAHMEAAATKQQAITVEGKRT